MRPPPPALHVLFFDGECGACAAAVRFARGRDRRGAFAFAPLGGETFERLVPPAVRATLPDSVVVVTAGGDVLVRSRATAFVLRELGGAWRAPAFVLDALPRGLADAGYDLVARVRRRLAPAPAACRVGDAGGRFLP